MAIRHWTAVAGALTCALTLSACQPTPIPSPTSSAPASHTHSAKPTTFATPAPSASLPQADESSPPVAGGSASVTPEAPAGAGDASKLTSALLLANQTGKHEGWMKGVPHYYSWAPGPETNYKYPQADSCLGWGEAYLDEAGPTTSNTRVAFKDIEIWVLSKSEGKWKRIAGPSAPDINAYPVDFQGNPKGADLTQGADGMQQVKVTDDAFNAHFWAVGGSTPCDLTDVEAVTSFFQARGVVDDASKPADIDAAKLLVASGVDYRQGGATGQVIGSLGLGKAVHVTKDWQYITVTNATKEQLAAHPFPAVS